MRTPDHERVVLNAVESQLRTEDPQLIACFMAFNSVTRPIRPADGWDRPAAGEERIRRGDPVRHRRVVQLVIVTCTLVAIVAGIVMSLLAGPQST